MRASWRRSHYFGSAFFQFLDCFALVSLRHFWHATGSYCYLLTVISYCRFSAGVHLYFGTEDYRFSSDHFNGAAIFAS
jgi:hypothetical protein